MKNYLKYSLGLIVFVMIALIAMHWLPAITIDGHTMRRVDLLSDVRLQKGVWYVSLSSAILLLKPIYLLRICGRCCKSVLEAVE